MNNLHFNNHISSLQDMERSLQDMERFAMKVFLEITNNKQGIFQISIDDGDGDVWKYTITIDVDRVKEVQQITEN